MKNILSYDKFSMNEGLFREIGRALSKRQKLDDIVEKLFENIKNNFNIKKLKYSGPNSDPERNKREYYIYEFEKDSFIKTVEETECTFHGNSYDIGGKTYKIFLGDDDITRLVNKYLIEDIHDFFISKENNRDSEKDKRKDDKLYRNIKDKFDKKPYIDPAPR
jgi:hypothetical protein